MIFFYQIISHNTKLRKKYLLLTNPNKLLITKTRLFKYENVTTKK